MGEIFYCDTGRTHNSAAAAVVTSRIAPQQQRLTEASACLLASDDVRPTVALDTTANGQSAAVTVHNARRRARNFFYARMRDRNTRF